jgi:hypothetical protein
MLHGIYGVEIVTSVSLVLICVSLALIWALD